MGIDNIWKKKKKDTHDTTTPEIVDVEINQTDQLAVQSYSQFTEDDRAAEDLMLLISQAIEKWSKMYHMDNLPKQIVFQQALSIMTAMERIYFK